MHVARATGLVGTSYRGGNTLGTCGGRYKSFCLDAMQASEKLHVHEVFGDTKDCGALLFAVECLQLLEFIIHEGEQHQCGPTAIHRSDLFRNICV